MKMKIEKNDTSKIAFTIIVIAVMALGLVANVFAESSTSSEKNESERSNENPSSQVIINELVKLKLVPQEESSDNGIAKYQLLIRDLHNNEKCKYVETENGSIRDYNVKCLSGTTYIYKLDFESLEGTNGEFSIPTTCKVGDCENVITSNVELTAGGEAMILLTVKTKNQGANPFRVTVSNGESEASIKGVLVYSNGPTQTNESRPSDTSYFIGEGFAVNTGETNGMLLSLNMLKSDSDLRGKLRVDKENFKLKGVINEDDTVDFTIVDINEKETVGTLKGKVKKFDNFLLFKGTLTFKGETWETTILSNKIGGVTKIDVSEETAYTTTGVNEIISVKKAKQESESSQGQETGDVYVKSVSVEKEKFLYIIPNPYGKKVLNVEVIDQGTITKEKIREFGEKQIEGYKVSVGSLDDEKNIEVSVEQTPSVN